MRRRQDNESVDIVETFAPVESSDVLIQFDQKGLVTLNEVRVIAAR